MEVISKKFALEATKAQIILGQKVPNLTEKKSIILSFDEMLLCAQYAKRKSIDSDGECILIIYRFDDDSVIVQKIERKVRFVNEF